MSAQESKTFTNQEALEGDSPFEVLPDSDNGMQYWGNANNEYVSLIAVKDGDGPYVPLRVDEANRVKIQWEPDSTPAAWPEFYKAHSGLEQVLEVWKHFVDEAHKSFDKLSEEEMLNVTLDLPEEKLKWLYFPSEEELFKKYHELTNNGADTNFSLLGWYCDVKSYDFWGQAAYVVIESDDDDVLGKFRIPLTYHGNYEKPDFYGGIPSKLLDFAADDNPDSVEPPYELCAWDHSPPYFPDNLKVYSLCFEYGDAAGERIPEKEEQMPMSDENTFYKVAAMAMGQPSLS